MPEQELENMDLYSDTTSQVSVMSSTPERGSKTNPLSIQTKASSSRTKSSKNRRKADRKKYSTKEGGMHEDIGLIASLHQLITDVYNLNVPEVTSLTRALMRVPGQFRCAKALQDMMMNLLNEISAREAIIWPHSTIKRDMDDRMVSKIIAIVFLKYIVDCHNYTTFCFGYVKIQPQVIFFFLQDESNVKYGAEATTAEIINSQQKSANSAIQLSQSFELLEARLRYPPLWPTGLGFRSRDDWKLQIIM